MPRSNRPRRSSRPNKSSRSNKSTRGQGSREKSRGGPSGWSLDFDGDGGWRHHGLSTVQHFSDGSWHVRGIASYGALKPYRCPGCDQIIAPGVSHLVAWRADGPRSDKDAEADRRHWHQRCWDHHAARR